MGFKSWLKDALFMEVKPEFPTPTDRKIYDVLSTPKSCKTIREELGEMNLRRRRTYKRLRMMIDMGLLAKNSDTFVRVEKKFGLRPRPNVWLNLLAGSGVVVSLPLNSTPLALFSLIFLGLNAGLF